MSCLGNQIARNVKYIICDVATSNHGKTTFLKEVAKILKNRPNSSVNVLAKRWRNDECFVWVDKKTGKTILVQTKGDNSQSFMYTLDYLRKSGGTVDIILCARHMFGQTKNVVQQIVSKYDYAELDFTHMYPQNKRWSINAVGVAKKKLSQAICDILFAI